ncbi:hypothetical protein FHS51_002647 [Sphingobium wenxiniae]|uniref:Uncharacterized protein n=1 Tax=Sphingobium wenxiniae (strain DSM 21828 / CGMCC 1.7748 / JZ-1) TaxID=595605 RepID=A0A562K9F0_SPHWJ|nr:hypothetical protein [Sphingobium wenxiniae]MBB6192404.1 hypothetical protein [Sphingobium wenxiniae]TWH91904.1 hypothetical protein IQ35_02803 [Sphingobium wenxiniae]
MADEIDTRVSLDLDPEAAMLTIVDYDDDTASYVSTAKSAFTEAFTSLRAIHDAKAAVVDDPTLTEAGALLKVDDFAQKRMIAKVYPLWDTASSTLNAKVEAWEKEMTKAVESKASQMVSSEIRAHFKGLKTGERMAAISQAIRDGDDVVASAVLGAPGMLSGIDDEMKPILLREYHERFNPGLAKRLRAVTAARDLIDSRMGVLKKEVAKAVGTIKLKGNTFDLHGQYSGEITPAQLRAKRDKSHKPFTV